MIPLLVASSRPASNRQSRANPTPGATHRSRAMSTESCGISPQPSDDRRTRATRRVSASMPCLEAGLGLRETEAHGRGDGCRLRRQGYPAWDKHGYATIALAGLVEAMDPAGGRFPDYGQNRPPTIVEDRNPDGWYCPRCCDLRVLGKVGDEVKVQCPGCAASLRCEVCGFGHPQVCTECGRNLEKMVSSGLALFCPTCHADYDNDDEDLAGLLGDRNPASEECLG